MELIVEECITSSLQLFQRLTGTLKFLLDSDLTSVAEYNIVFCNECTYGQPVKVIDRENISQQVEGARLVDLTGPRCLEGGCSSSQKL